MLKRSSKLFLVALMLVAAVMMFGCGSDGSDGAPGPAGPPGPPGQDAVAPAIPADAVEPETCVICHGSVDQTEHQTIYNEYKDADNSGLTLTIINVTSQAGVTEGTFDATVTFTITQNGAPYTDTESSTTEEGETTVDGLPSIDQKRFYAVAYNPATGTFDNSVSFGGINTDTTGDGENDTNTNFISTGNPGEFEAYAQGANFDPTAFTDGELYGYVAKGKLETEGMTLYGEVANAALTLGAGGAADYASPANVAGCEKCHGTPYRKHGYREAQVAGLGDFAACKTCHYDTRNGGHQDWQIIVTDPERYTTIYDKSKPVTDEEKAQYAYTANVMNDVHMSHSMEFPYPQSMSNCATCHEGKLDIIQADENFTAATCKSCHPVTTTVDFTNEDTIFATSIHEDAAPSLQQIWDERAPGLHDNIDLETVECNTCHSAGSGFGAALFSAVMPGYNPMIYADNSGKKYSEIFTATVDSAEYADNILTVSFSLHETDNTTAWSLADITPVLQVGLYGYETKDFIVSPHSNSGQLEGDIDPDNLNPRFTIDSAPGDGTFIVKVDLSDWANMIDSVTVKRAEIAVRPALRNPDAPFGFGRDGITPNPYAIDAVSETFDFTKPGLVDDFFGGNNAESITDVKGCNNCHDALATTFHSADRGGNITVCRLCHVSSSGGSHLEVQSRAIDSYAHAIHSFQVFDFEDYDFTNPIEATKYGIHVEHVFPNFTAKNCEACHNPGKYMVPDEFYSLAAVLSPNEVNKDEPNLHIGTVPSYVTGPGYRSCGGCHRADFIKEGEAGKLASLNGHARDMGYLVEAGKDSTAQLSTWEKVVETIQSMFH